jgi:hypothetical protein
MITSAVRWLANAVRFASGLVFVRGSYPSSLT